MSLWDDVWCVTWDRRYYAPGLDSGELLPGRTIPPDDAVAFPCTHCKAAIGLFACTFVENRWDEQDRQIVGGLYCPRCGKNTARSYARMRDRQEREAQRVAREDEADADEADADEL